MAVGRRNGRGGGKLGGKVSTTADNTPLTSTELSPEKSPVVSAQASPQALPKSATGMLDESAKVSLQERLSALKVNWLKDREEEGDVTKHPQPSTSSAGLPDRAAEVSEGVTAGCSKYADDDECWDSDDDDDFDPAAVHLLTTQVSFPITLLIPIKWESEVPKLKATVVAHLDFWNASLTADARTTTKYQELMPAWLSKKRFGRLQVTFQHASDAAFVWMRSIEHELGKGVSLTLDWQHPENATYRCERQLNPDAVEVLLKSVPAGVSPDLIRKMLTEVTLLKKGKAAFAKGVGFHRVHDPVTGMDTDKGRGRTGCVVATCDKAQGASFEQASAHVASLRHKTNLAKPGAATRASKGAINLATFRKDFTK
ncbi:unnamed protein product [Closterium sp. Naga37s-1]|nr:unnamed protein product [Closterium sp. Naga37s-1]